MNEHEFEPVKGLPSALPDGEYIVWQGSPKWQSLAVRAFHVRKIAIYFLFLIGFCIASLLVANESFSNALPSIKMLVLGGSVAVGILISLAYLYSKTTMYTVTNRRIVLRIGIAVQMMINIPWEKVDSAGICEFSDNTGDILIETNSGEKISYWVLWPHTRPWSLLKAQPMLRSLPDADTAGTHISNLLNQHISVHKSPSVKQTTRESLGSPASA